MRVIASPPYTSLELISKANGTDPCLSMPPTYQIARVRLRVPMSSRGHTKDRVVRKMKPWRTCFRGFRESLPVKPRSTASGSS
jgi:hypothetical protein